MKLQAIQQWLWSVLLQSSDSEKEVERIIYAGNLPALDRLAIYARGYRLRLLECLHAEFPVLHALLGTALFDAFALNYLSSNPSTSYTLNDLSANFPGHLAAQRPDASDETPHEDWVDFIIDLAHLERVTSEVYDGFGDEGENPVTSLSVSRSLRLLRLSHPVHELITAYRLRLELCQPQPRTTWLAVVRRNYRVLIEPLNMIEFKLFHRLQAGEIEAVLTEVRAGAGAEGLERWMQRQIYRGLLLPMYPLHQEITPKINGAISCDHS